MQNYEKIKEYCLNNLGCINYSNHGNTIYKQDLVDFIHKNGLKIKDKAKREDLVVQIVENESLLEKFINKYPYFIYIYIHDILEFYDLDSNEYEYLKTFKKNQYSFDEFKNETTYENNYSIYALMAYSQDELKESFKELIHDDSKRCHIQIIGNSVAETELLLEHLKCFFDVLNIDQGNIFSHGLKIDADAINIPNIQKEERKIKDDIEKLKQGILESKESYEILDKTIHVARYARKCPDIDVLLDMQKLNLLDEIYKRFPSTVFQSLIPYKDLKIIECFENNRILGNTKIIEIYNEDEEFKNIINFIISEKYFNNKSWLEILNQPIDKICDGIVFKTLPYRELKKIEDELKQNKEYSWVTMKKGYTCDYFSFWSEYPEKIELNYRDITYGITSNTIRGCKDLKYKTVLIRGNFLNEYKPYLISMDEMIKVIELLLFLTKNGYKDYSFDENQKVDKSNKSEQFDLPFKNIATTDDIHTNSDMDNDEINQEERRVWMPKLLSSFYKNKQKDEE